MSDVVGIPYIVLGCLAMFGFEAGEEPFTVIDSPVEIDANVYSMVTATKECAVSIYRITIPSFTSSLMSDAGSVVTSLTSWVGSVARMVINTPVLLIGFTIALATLAFGVFKSLKR